MLSVIRLSELAWGEGLSSIGRIPQTNALARILAFLLILIASYPGIAGSQEPQDDHSSEPASAALIVEGWAPLGTPPDTAAARKSAIDSALVLAVDQRLGGSIHSTREMRNHVLLSSRIEKSVSGEVAKYQILDEAALEDVYWVRLEVTLLDDLIGSLGLDRLQIGLALSTPDEPSPIQRQTALNKISAALTDIGLATRPLDPANDGPDSGLGDTVDLLIKVDYTAREKNAIGGLSMAEVALNAELLRPDRSETLGKFETKLDGSRTTSPEASAEAALVLGVEALSNWLARTIDSSTSTIIRRQLLVTGLPTRSDADRIERELSNASGVGNIHLKNFKDHAAEWQVELSPEGERRLADLVQHIPGLDLEVYEQNQDWILARMPVSSGGVPSK